MIRRLLFALAVMICAAVLTPRASWAAERFVVVGDMLPIMEHAGDEYVIENGELVWSDDLPEPLGLVVYGNIVEAEPDGEWARLAGPEGGEPLGWIRCDGLMPMPSCEPIEPADYIAAKDEPDLRLLPSFAGIERKLSARGYSLLVGEVVRATARFAEAGTEWLLFEFGSDTYHGGSGGSGSRWAWGRATDFVRADEWGDLFIRVDERWLGTRTRTQRRDAYDDDYDRDATSFLMPPDVREGILASGAAIERTPDIVRFPVVDDISDRYSETARYAHDFITTDVMMHAYHKIFNNAQKDMERTLLAPRLTTSLRAALAALDAAELPGPLRRASSIARDMLTVPLFLLGELQESELSDAARGEAGRIASAEGSSTSLLTGQRTDYTQYRPRGHYAADEALSRYFRAMTFMGQEGIQLFEPDGRTPKPTETATAAMIVLALDAAGDAWRSFNGPLDYIFGTPDDGTFADFCTEVLRTAPSFADAHRLADDDVAAVLANRIKDRVGVSRIRDRETGNISKEDAASRGIEFRMSGKRFTFDAYTLGSLMSPRVGSDERPRNLPAVSDVMAVLGSPAADELSDEWNDIPGYADALRRIKDERDAMLADDTSYCAWLRAIAASLADSGSTQVFYRSPEWQWKKLSTASASYAELKHDTVLYAKQAGAEMGDGGYWTPAPFAPPQPRGYVEPDPQAFAAIRDAVQRFRDLMARYGLDMKVEMYGMEQTYDARLMQFANMCETARRIADAEVRGTRITAADYADIKSLARSFTGSLLYPLGADYVELDERRMAIVTDIATDFMSGRALHIASGAPSAIWVWVADRSGGARVARGWVYNFYEFPRDLSKGRMTDAEWREIVYDKTRAAELEALRPSWYGRIGAR